MILSLSYDYRGKRAEQPLESVPYRVFGLRNKLIIYSSVFVWFVEWNGFIHHHLITNKLIISTSMRNEAIPPNLRNGLMMHHLGCCDSSNQHPIKHV
jgi:hypothetical protein